MIGSVILSRKFSSYWKQSIFGSRVRRLLPDILAETLVVGESDMSTIEIRQGRQITLARWWFQRLFIFTPNWVEDEPILTSIYFSNGLVQPPTRIRFRNPEQKTYLHLLRASILRPYRGVLPIQPCSRVDPSVETWGPGDFFC